MAKKRRKPTLERVGRPTVLTPEIEARICKSVREGMPLRVSAGVARVAARTVTGWMKRGRETNEEPYASFVDAVEAAQADALQKQLKRLLDLKVNSKQKRALAHVVERLYPSFFDPTHSVRLLERQKLRAELSKNDQQTGDVAIIIECEPQPSAGEAPVAADVAAGAGSHRD